METVPKILSRNELKKAVHVLANAFMEDDFSKYIEPNAKKRFRTLLSLFGATTYIANHYGYILTSGSPIQGVLVWLPPEAYPLSSWQKLKAGLLKCPFLMGISAAKRLMKVMNFSEKNKLDVLKGRPCWHLHLAGVLPINQGEGIGSNLITRIHSLFDVKKEVSFLVTNNEKSVRFWQRFGYKVKLEKVFPGEDLTFWYMVRNDD